MPALPDQLCPGLVRLQVFANFYLSIPVDELRSHLINQGIYAGPDDRIDPEIVIAALDRELAAGRPFSPRPLKRV